MIRIIKIALALAVLYFMIIISAPWVKYFIYKNAAVKIIAENYKISTNAFKKILLEHAKELNIPLKAEDIQITTYDDNKIEIVITYFEKVNFPIINKGIVFNYEIKRDTYFKGED